MGNGIPVFPFLVGGDRSANTNTNKQHNEEKTTTDKTHEVEQQSNGPSFSIIYHDENMLLIAEHCTTRCQLCKGSNFHARWTNNSCDIHHLWCTSGIQLTSTNAP